MNDFDMYLTRLENNPHEPVSLNAITRMIAEWLGYTLTPRFKQAPSQWQLATPDGRFITFKARGTDVDAAWHVARTKGYTPNWVGSVDAALKLPLPDGCYMVITTPVAPYKNYEVRIYRKGEYTDEGVAIAHSPMEALARVAAWWQAVNSEQKEG